MAVSIPTVIAELSPLLSIVLLFDNFLPSLCVLVKSADVPSTVIDFAMIWGWVKTYHSHTGAGNFHIHLPAILGC